MEVTMGLLTGGSGVSATDVGLSSEGSSYSPETELELGLGLSLGSGVGSAANGGVKCRILTAKDFPSVVSSGSRVAVSGTKRCADSVSHEAGSSPPRSSQVVGWPPIGIYRMNSLVNQPKTLRPEEEKKASATEERADDVNKNIYSEIKNNIDVKEKGRVGFVKAYMDGMGIGRKVNVSAHSCYETLAQMLENMFFKPNATINSNGSGGEKQCTKKLSKLLDGSSEFALTYEDKEGDWMLVGDVPWGMFLSTVKRLRIMRTSEANGLAPEFQQSNEKQRSKPI